MNDTFALTDFHALLEFLYIMKIVEFSCVLLHELYFALYIRNVNAKKPVL